MDLDALFGRSDPLVGMVHLPPLPGAPGYEGDREAIRERAVTDVRALERGGMDAVLVENFGDAPFYPESVPKHVVADVTAVTRAVVGAVDCPVGVNVLRNDAESALSVAAATGADFVRVNVHAGAVVTDQGIVEGRAHETVRLRERIDASDVWILADVGVKHASSLGNRSIESQARDVAERSGADAVVVSGEATGDPTPRGAIRSVKETVEDFPVFVGSGVSPDSVGTILDLADGAIVGTALKEDGTTTAPVDPERVEELVAVARER